MNRSVVSLKITNLEKKKLLNRTQKVDKDHGLFLTSSGNMLVENLINSIGIRRI